MSLSVINERLDQVSELLEHEQLCEEIMSALQRTTDVLRLLQRFSIGRGDADDLLALAKTVRIVGQIVALMNDHVPEHQELVNTSTNASSSSSLRLLVDRLDLDGPSKLASRILDAIDEDGLSQQHLAEEAEAVGIAELAEPIIETEDSRDKPAKRGKSDGKKNTVGADLNSGEFWIMRKS
jgi:DNA mismatch repair ATPase MutS